MYDIIIIGSGPAGLTAGIYAVRAGRKALLIGGTQWGGQLMLTTLVENFPGFPEGIQGPALMTNMRKQAERLGLEIVNSEFIQADFSQKPFIVRAGKEKYEVKSVIIATGADSIWLNIEGEAELRGKGVGVCATCDAFFFRGKDVAVIGGGDSALEEAHFLSKMTRSVTIIHRRGEFRASKAMQEKVTGKKNVKILWNKVVEKFLGKEKLTGLLLKDTVTQKEQELKVDGAFVAVGHKPNSGKFKGIDLDAKGYIVRKEVFDEEGRLKYRSATNTPGVFVAGDVDDYRYRQAITASAFGCMAALDADRWLEEDLDS